MRDSDAVRFIGIDGCRGGWAVMALDESGFVSFEVMQTADLPQKIQPNDVVLMDIPIGLSDSESPRLCDAMLRKKLGKNYASAVFSPPVRAAVYAQSYQEACMRNQKITGKKISIQSWNICPKIREIDLFLQQHPHRISQFRETHPELLFAHWNNDKPLLYKKKTAEGFRERVSLLMEQIPEFATVIDEILTQWKRASLKPDDIVDAAILAVHARQYHSRGFRTLPESAPVDRFHIPMAIHM